jgi:hypothetical protein
MSKEFNILILSVGRRVELVKLFQKALKSLNLDGKVIGADIIKTAPALQFVDSYHIIERVDNENYIKSILDICMKEKINLIIPTIDTELMKLAENKKMIEDISDAKINISDLSVIKVCRDKKATQEFFEKNNFLVPKEITLEDLKLKKYTFPLFIKPLNGSSSMNTFKITNEEELNFFIKYVPNPIIQEMIFGDEYTVDIFCDFNSEPITIVPRKRIATRSGEISKGIILKDREIIEEIKKLVKSLKPKGHITVQCIKTKKGVEFIEINPRFGGGAPMSIVAGANSCENLISLCLGKELKYNENYKDNLLCLRYDETVFIEDFKEDV